MRLYTVSAIESYQTQKVPGRPDKPRLGKNGGPLVNLRGVISTRAVCEAFVVQARLDGCLSTSLVRYWRGQ